VLRRVGKRSRAPAAASPLKGVSDMSILVEESPKRRVDACIDSRKWVSKPGGHAAAIGMEVLTPLSAMNLEGLLAQLVTERTGGRVRMIQVEICAGRVILSGCASSYHAVQLALSGLQQAFRELRLDRPERVELDFDVPPTGP
jgi:hypothetical protein